MYSSISSVRLFVIGDFFVPLDCALLEAATSKHNNQFTCMCMTADPATCAYVASLNDSTVLHDKDLDKLTPTSSTGIDRSCTAQKVVIELEQFNF